MSSSTTTPHPPTKDPEPPQESRGPDPLPLGRVIVLFVIATATWVTALVLLLAWFVGAI